MGVHLTAVTQAEKKQFPRSINNLRHYFEQFRGLNQQELQLGIQLNLEHIPELTLWRLDIYIKHCFTIKSFNNALKQCIDSIMKIR